MGASTSGPQAHREAERFSMLPLEMTPVTPRVPSGSQAESALVHSGHVHTPPDHLTGAQTCRLGGRTQDLKSGNVIWEHLGQDRPRGRGLEHMGASMLQVQEDKEETDLPLLLHQEKESSLEEKKIKSLKVIQYLTAVREVTFQA